MVVRSKHFNSWVSVMLIFSPIKHCDRLPQQNPTSFFPQFALKSKIKNPGNAGTAQHLNSHYSDPKTPIFSANHPHLHAIYTN